jgi:hypothetical protein
MRGDASDARPTRPPGTGIAAPKPSDAVMGFVDAAYLIAGRRYETLLPCDQSKRLPERNTATTARSDLQHQKEIA